MSFDKLLHPDAFILMEISLLDVIPDTLGASERLYIYCSDYIFTANDIS